MAASLRSYRAGDADAVVELSRVALSRPELHVGNPIWTTREELDTEVGDWEPPAEETLCVAEDDEGRVVGFAGVEHPRGFLHAELFGPLVAIEARGHRLGSGLLDRSIEIARGLGAESVIASVGKANSRGRMILEAAGFRAHGRPQATFRLSRREHLPLGEPPAETEVRRATGDDLPAALELYRECFPEGRFPEAVWRENLEEGTVYAAVHQGDVVAVLNIDPTDRWIYHVGVTASERNRGVGSFLLSRSLEDYWGRHPGETLGLDVDRDNVPAIKLYRRQGFAPWLVLQSFELAL